jgi:alkylglycerol monooxygenase
MDYSPTLDGISGLMSGATNAVKDVLQLSFTVLSYAWLVSKLAVVHLEESWIMYLIVFVALDFQGYWTHRWAHEINFFWNKHLVHHSSEEYNLACALRQSISSFVNLFTFFLIPCALLGIPPIVIATIAPIHLFAQFWYHTRHIGKMGWLEQIIVTPSHHRVHHAINPEYLDKNYSQIFIIWDKLFGTFQPELPNVPAVYGITRPVSTFNPIKINFQHLWLLITDAWRAQSWRDKLRIWFMPTGWRPADVAAQYPVHKISDVYQFHKYQPRHGRAVEWWSVFQLLAHLALVAYFFSHIGTIGSPDVFYYGFFFFLSVYAMSEWMDGSAWAAAWELVKAISGLAWIYQTGSWFGIDSLMSGATGVVAGYFILSLLGCLLIKPAPDVQLA